MTKAKRTDSSQVNQSKAPGPGIPCPMCGAEYLYDCPNLGPVAFLQAVMHASNVPIRDRIKAATHLLHLKDKGIYSDEQPEPDYKVIIPEVTLQ